MASNALKKITTRAKQIRKAHPGTSWKGAVKKAGAEYRAGKKPAKRKKASRPAHRKARSVSGVRKSHKGRVGSVEPRYEVVHQLRQVSGVTYKGGTVRIAGVADIEKKKRQLKAALGEQAGWLDVAISSEKTASGKKKLRKKKREIISELNRIN
jgi:hypothetical protein